MICSLRYAARIAAGRPSIADGPPAARRSGIGPSHRYDDRITVASLSTRLAIAAGIATVDPVLRIPDEPGKMQGLALARLYGQAPARGAGSAVPPLRRGRRLAPVVRTRAPGRLVRAGGEQCARDCDKRRQPYETKCLHGVGFPLAAPAEAPGIEFCASYLTRIVPPSSASRSIRYRARNIARASRHRRGAAATYGYILLRTFALPPPRAPGCAMIRPPFGDTMIRTAPRHKPAARSCA